MRGSQASAMRDLVVACVLLGVAAAGRAASPPWYDLDTLPGEVGEQLRDLRGQACTGLELPELPVAIPEDAELVLLACSGGPHACREGRAAGSAGVAFRCPPRPALTELATVHLVTRRPVERLAALYAGQLGAHFERVAGEGETAFVQRPARPGSPAPAWSPKRLHVRVAEARGPFAAAGYTAQVRLSFSARRVYPPVSVIGCYLRAEALERVDPERAEALRLRRDLTGQCRPLR